MFESLPSGRLLNAAATAGALVLLTACASAPTAPVAALNEARLAIEVAERGDASRYAGAELDEARQQLLSADRAVMVENMVQAERYANQSTVMAELAAAKTEAAEALAVNEELNRGAVALIEEMQRTGEQR
jgi:hypothetical protein